MAAEPARKPQVVPGPAAAAAAAVSPAKAKKPGKGKRLWIIVAAVICAAAVGAWFAFKPSPEQKPAGQSAAPRAAPIYYKFDPAFVVNFGSEGNARYLQVTVEAMSRDAAVLELIKNNEPAVRNDLVLLLSAQEYSALMTPEGKERLRAATLQAIRKTVIAEGGDGQLVEAVYFTSFVIQ
ncbi:MAG: flagellar basal body-associated protein FliL [Steroidobacterales bacterium]